MPGQGFAVEDAGYIEPVKDGSTIQVQIDPKSDRLESLSPFKEPKGGNISGLRLLIKAKGNVLQIKHFYAWPLVKVSRPFG